VGPRHMPIPGPERPAAADRPPPYATRRAWPPLRPAQEQPGPTDEVTPPGAWVHAPGAKHGGIVSASGSPLLGRGRVSSDLTRPLEAPLHYSKRSNPSFVTRDFVGRADKVCCPARKGQPGPIGAPTTAAGAHGRSGANIGSRHGSGRGRVSAPTARTSGRGAPGGTPTRRRGRASTGRTAGSVPRARAGQSWDAHRCDRCAWPSLRP
jgi:hypothetical protein